jgi:TatA/E family protein of Tat protein translocase
MFTGHITELLIVLFLGLMIFGPKRLPEMGGAVAQTIRDFKNTMSHDAAPLAPEPLPVEVPVHDTGIS